MEPDFITYLPSEVIKDIFLRLHVRTISISKCVCKSWLYLLEADDFVKIHLAKSVPTLAALSKESYTTLLCSVSEYEDRIDHEHHDFPYNLLTEFDFPRGEKLKIQGAANGLLLLLKVDTEPAAHYICNPITRDYIEICFPEEFVGPDSQVVSYGFGASKIVGQHKVVRISFYDGGPKNMIVSKPECYVYTLGKGSWRSVEPSAPFTYYTNDLSALFNGNLHWVVVNSKYTTLVSCFDLETEKFSTFSTPFRHLGRTSRVLSLSALGDYLCLCIDVTLEEGGLAIWLMEEYGVEKSWTKKYMIVIGYDGFIADRCKPNRVIKVFKDGDILMQWKELFFYSTKTGNYGLVNLGSGDEVIDSILLTPSLLSPKNLVMENAISF